MRRSAAQVTRPSDISQCSHTLLSSSQVHCRRNQCCEVELCEAGAAGETHCASNSGHGSGHVGGSIVEEGWGRYGDLGLLLACGHLEETGHSVDDGLEEVA